MSEKRLIRYACKKDVLSELKAICQKVVGYLAVGEEIVEIVASEPLTAAEIQAIERAIGKKLRRMED